jgi:hypothetical protein
MLDPLSDRLPLVFVLVAARRLFGTRLAIWQIMLGGALAVLAGGLP